MVPLKTYLDMILPGRFKEAIARESRNDDSQATFLNIIIIASLGLGLLFIQEWLRAAGMGIFSYPAYQGDMLGGYSKASSILGFIVTFAFTIILFYLGYFILHSIAGMLGGKGKFGNLVYLNSIVELIYVAVTYPLMALEYMDPLLYCVLTLPLLALLIYRVYIGYLILRAVHNSLSRERAIAATLAQWFVVGIIMAVYLGARFALGI